MSEACANCKHWQPYAEYDSYFMFPYEHGVDEGARWGTCGREHAPNPPMFTNDASLYFSALRTLSGHHCKEWMRDE